MAMFSAATIMCLQHAGWHNDRRVDTSEYYKCLNSEGYPVHAVVIEFLERFGGLRVVHPHHRAAKTNDEFCINPTLAAADVYPERISDYSDRVGTPLCVIGEAFQRHMVLMMDQNGQVYAGYDDLLIHVGDSGTDAIEALCSGRDMPKVP